MRTLGDEHREAEAHRLLDEVDAMLLMSSAGTLVRAGILIGTVQRGIRYDMGDGSERERVDERLSRIASRIPGGLVFWDSSDMSEAIHAAADAARRERGA